MRCDLVICSCILPYCWIPTSITIVLDDHFSHSTTEPRVLKKWCVTFLVSDEETGIVTFPSYLMFRFQNESSCKTFHMTMSLICMGTNALTKDKNIRFKTETKSNTEMAYFWIISQWSNNKLNFERFCPLFDTPFNVLRNFVRVSLPFVRKFRTKQVVRRICEA